MKKGPENRTPLKDVQSRQALSVSVDEKNIA